MTADFGGYCWVMTKYFYLLFPIEFKNITYLNMAQNNKYKNYFKRSTMSTLWLRNLAMLSIVRELTDEIVFHWRFCQQKTAEFTQDIFLFLRFVVGVWGMNELLCCEIRLGDLTTQTPPSCSYLNVSKCMIVKNCTSWNFVISKSQNFKIS